MILTLYGIQSITANEAIENLIKWTFILNFANCVKMIEKLKEQRLFAVGFMVLYLLQNEIIYPFESAIRTDSFASMASLTYLPHGMKVFCALILGVWSLPLIFVAQTLNTLYFLGSFNWPMLGSSTLAIFSIGIPIVLLNRTLKQSMLTAPIAINSISISTFWLFISLAFITAMLNSFMQTLVYGLPDSALHWYFLVGDIVGSAVFFVLASGIMAAIKLLQIDKKAQKS